MPRPTKAIIDADALRHNLQLAQNLSPESKTIAMVKANAYGHNAIEVAKVLSPITDGFGVASIDEALELRKYGITLPILLLEGTFSSAEVEIAANNNFWVVVENQPQLDAIVSSGSSLPQKLTVWLGMDSGMHRLGFQPEEIESKYIALSECPNVNDEIVIMSHFACADDLSNNATLKQIQRFDEHMPSVKDKPLLTSLANSAGILGWPQASRTWQRPGYMLYGNSPFYPVPNENADKLQPVMTFQSAVISVRTIKAGESVGYTARWTAERESVIATITVGYGDGYPRQAPNGTPVLINGIRCPLVGRVSMDMITVNCTDLPIPVKIGDTVILWGPDLPVNEVASMCDTIGYELLTRMPARVPRVICNL